MTSNFVCARNSHANRVIPRTTNMRTGAYKFESKGKTFS